MIKITICITKKEKIDIGVNQKQTIAQTVLVLTKKGIVKIPETTYVRVPRINRLVSVLCTYEEVGIIEGDILMF